MIGSPKVRWRVREAGDADVDAIATTMAAAFIEDPVMAWMFPARRTRASKLHDYFLLMQRHLFLPRSRVLVTHDLGGAAFWVPPGAWPLDPIDGTSFAHAAGALFGSRARMLESGTAVIDSFHPGEAHHYLAGIGVEPSRQSAGVGASLLAPVLAICDRDGVGAYLEASTLRNVALYERLDFRVRRELSLPQGPPLFLMWRPPQKA